MVRRLYAGPRHDYLQGSYPICCMPETAIVMSYPTCLWGGNLSLIKPRQAPRIVPVFKSVGNVIFVIYIVELCSSNDATAHWQNLELHNRVYCGLLIFRQNAARWRFALMWLQAYAVARSSRIWGSRISRERFDVELLKFTRTFIPVGWTTTLDMTSI